MNRYFYIFVRQDIPIEQQIIQTAHATIEMTKLCKIEDIPYVVMIGIPDEVWMGSVIKHLKALKIEHAEFLDTDFDFGVASVVTVPLTEDQRTHLRHYPLWRPKP